mmetsp:Transcript_68639/g.200870  ORF Transcript_68639/g.200870 Transcript_68639/m.200870 type:complete len:242 (+) Transcript_68639:1565-2290(+)
MARKSPRLSKAARRSWLGSTSSTSRASKAPESRNSSEVSTSSKCPGVATALSSRSRSASTASSSSRSVLVNGRSGPSCLGKVAVAGPLWIEASMAALAASASKPGGSPLRKSSLTSGDTKNPRNTASTSNSVRPRRAASRLASSKTEKSSSPNSVRWSSPHFAAMGSSGSDGSTHGAPPPRLNSSASSLASASLSSCVRASILSFMSLSRALAFFFFRRNSSRRASASCCFKRLCLSSRTT